MRELLTMPGYSNGKGLVSKTSGRKALGVQVSSPALKIFEGRPWNFQKSSPGFDTSTCAEGAKVKIVFKGVQGRTFSPKVLHVHLYSQSMHQ
jgi:hypothetical protein